MPKKILLADDSITIQKVVELTFSDGDYEVSAVNNGAKAIQKLSEMRPDIILSDIIMPEKNGYEVCEFVKSHPEYRNIPVVLLTGTFEPFDPDRADKAGCDAVVTKPFESQSLIQKVEELIAQAQSAPPPAPEPEPEPASFVAEASPWEEEQPAAFTPPPPPPPAAFTPPPPPAAEPFASGFQTHDSDIFGSTPPTAATTMETPFESGGGYGGETRAFPRMSFEDLQQMANETPAAPPPPPPAPEPSPWDEPAPITGGETRAFPRMSFEELQQMAATPAPTPEPAPEVTPEISPWDAGPIESAAAGDTMSPFASEPPIMPEPTPWDQQPSPAFEEPASPFAETTSSPFGEEPAFGGETRAFPRMSFEELQQMASPPAPEPEPPAAIPEPEPETSPWDQQPPEQPAFSAETRAFPRMSFEELQQASSQPAAPPEEETSPWDEPAASPFEATAAPPMPAWTPAEEPAATESFSTEADSPFGESLEQQEAPFEPEMTAPMAPTEEAMWSPSQPEALAAAPTAVNSQITDAVAPHETTEEAFPTAVNDQITDTVSTDVNPQITDAVAPPSLVGVTGATGAIPAAGADLTDAQIDRIARRVVELMSEQVVKNIAWEVIPDLAEMVVKERIRQLESEA